MRNNAGNGRNASADQVELHLVGAAELGVNRIVHHADNTLLRVSNCIGDSCRQFGAGAKVGLVEEHRRAPGTRRGHQSRMRREASAFDSLVAALQRATQQACP